MNENVLAKLKILAESAKYDVSCSSSGTVRSNKPGMLGNTVGGWGICHSFAEDGRCISLLKIMLTNYCIYDCAYCVNRRSNDLARATFSVSAPLQRVYPPEKHSRCQSRTGKRSRTLRRPSQRQRRNPQRRKPETACTGEGS